VRGHRERRNAEVKVFTGSRAQLFLIAPSLGQDAAFFYEDDGRKLRERFDIYPEALHARLDFFNELEQKQTQLLSQIRSERRKR
jgi:hypothetical protein